MPIYNIALLKSTHQVGSSVSELVCHHKSHLNNFSGSAKILVVECTSDIIFDQATQNKWSPKPRVRVVYSTCLLPFYMHPKLGVLLFLLKTQEYLIILPQFPIIRHFWLF